jgi:hypothetical protein
MDLTLARIGDEELVLIGMLGGIAIIIALLITVASMAKTRQREQTRREVAAYVAEGSIKAEDAAQLLSAEPDQLRASVADAVAWGTMSAKNAERLLNAADRAKSAPRAS